MEHHGSPNNAQAAETYRARASRFRANIRWVLAARRAIERAAKEIAHADGERASRDTVRREVGPSVCQTCFGSGHDLFDKTVACPDCHKGEK